MSTERKDPRNQSYAKILLDGSMPAYMRDISPQGFRVYSPVPLPYKEGSRISCKVIPSDGEPFDIEGEIRWNRQGEDGEDIMGFRISSFTDAEGESRYKEMNKRFSTQK
ncbi:MAG: PilZ domain-containing protein [Spirochaetales bacterium]|nr:PilZ domain-containing protein [Spirochaetales bacterium]